MLTHKQKKTLARKLLTSQERKRKNYPGLFASKGWNLRREAISQKAERRNKRGSANETAEVQVVKDTEQRLEVG